MVLKPSKMVECSLWHSRYILEFSPVMWSNASQNVLKRSRIGLQSTPSFESSSEKSCFFCFHLISSFRTQRSEEKSMLVLFILE